MNPAWALRLPLQHAGRLGPLRQTPGLEVLADGDTLWLRGDDPAAAESLAVRSLPAEGRYTVQPDHTLIPRSRRLPVGTLPGGDWGTLAAWLCVTAPTAGFPGQTDRRVPLSLVRSAGERPAELLITGPTHAARWADSASQLRLAALSVAVDREHGRVALRGTPLPPLPGERYTVRAGVALPAGLAFAKPVTCEDAAKLVGLDGEDLALFDRDGAWSLLPGDCFIAATRATLRGMGARC